ncbi:3-hydroxyisobutyrate dehydrogenase [Scophthalmus maximus]|uniref:3-hydroxyisobutyrate dehydrogenase n=2 Tax=Scophthalmus maximus TaxID=52904 RepID=A0A2U9CZC6_SCOMX|nr:3-hydroxyisobutyrate dehydrogenase [Scophthalmus maximus]
MSRLCFIPSGCLNSPRVVIGLHHDSARSAHPGLDSCHCAPRSRQRSMAALFRGSRNVLLRWNKHVDLAYVSMRSMASKTPVGFIGLGNMGSPMAKNLLKNGYPVIATDVFPESCKELQDLGAQVLDSPADVAEKADRIITMLPSSPNVIEVYTGPNGILKKVKKGTLLIDSSTIDPSVSKEMAVAAEKMGAVFMDAPVSGGVGAASLAKLTFMVGGVEEEYNAAQELLTCMGANVVYCGQVGTGQAAKICNNMLLAIGMIGTAETMNLGIRLGLDPKLLAKILNMSSGRCWSSDTYNPVPGVMDGVPSANNYQGGFGTTLMAKDLGLAQNTATNTKTPVPLGSLAHQIFRVMCSRGYANKDFSSVFQFLREEEGQ